MTITSTLSKLIFQLNGAQTVFAFSFVGVSASYIQVTYTDTSGNITVLPSSAYSVSLNAATTGNLWGVGGTVTYAPGGSPASNGTLTVARVIPYEQLTSISNQTALLQSVIEQALDTIDMQVQQIADVTSRSVAAPISDPAGTAVALPSAVARAGKFLAFDGLGNVIASVASVATAAVSSFMQSVLGSASALAFLAAIGTAAIPNVGMYGADNSGINDTSAALTAADAAKALYLAPGIYRVSTNLTLTNNVQFAPGAQVSIDAGKVLTFNGNLDAWPDAQLFIGSGTVSLPNQRTPVYAEWWGAKANNTTYCDTAFNAAAAALTNGGTIQCLNGQYAMNGGVSITTKVDIVGVGWGLNPSEYGTIFRPSATFAAQTTTPMFYVNYGSTALRDFGVVGSSSYAFAAVGTGPNCGLNVFQRLYFNGVGTGFNLPHGNGLEVRQIRCQAMTTGFYLGGTSGLFPGDIKFQEIVTIPNAGGVSVLIDGNTNALYFHRLECIGGGVGVSVRGSGSGTTQPQGLFFWDSNITAQSSYGVAVAYGRQIQIFNSWIGGVTAGPGIIINASTAANADGILLQGCTIGSNWLHGINYQVGANLVVNECYLIGNGQAAANTYNGLYVQAGVAGSLTVTGTVSTNTMWNQSGSQNTGIYLVAGALTTAGAYTGRLTITGCTLGGNTTAGLQNFSAPAGGYLNVANNQTT